MFPFYNTEIPYSEKCMYNTQEVCEQNCQSGKGLLNLSGVYFILLEKDIFSLELKPAEEEQLEKKRPNKTDRFFKTDRSKWDTNPKTDTREFHEGEELKRKWSEKYELFQSAFEKKKNIFPKSIHEFIGEEFKMVLWNVLQLQPDRSGVEISQDESVYIYTEFGNKSISLDLFFEEPNEMDALVCIMDNHEPVLSYNGSIGKCMDKIKGILETC